MGDAASAQGPLANTCRSGAAVGAAPPLCSVTIDWNAGTVGQSAGSATSIEAAGWSARSAPTPGRSTSGVTPSARRSVAGPIPERSRIAGLA